MKLLTLRHAFLLIALLGISPFLFTGCSDDESDPEPSLVGTWVATDIDYSGTATTKIFGNPVSGDFTGEATEIDYTLTMNEDGTFQSSGSYTVNLKTTFAGQTTTQEIPFSSEQALGSGTWEKSGNTLIITSMDQTSEGTITELSENVFAADVSIEALTSDPTFGVDVLYDADISFRFERQ